MRLTIFFKHSTSVECVALHGFVGVLGFDLHCCSALIIILFISKRKSFRILFFILTSFNLNIWLIDSSFWLISFNAGMSFFDYGESKMLVGSGSWEMSFGSSLWVFILKSEGVSEMLHGVFCNKRIMSRVDLSI